ncbi:glycosyltransferase [Hyphomonas sp. WL0036]|uniref:glycosyltransferase family 2 protein n=1 Tax=Hyphomonas sediminis TaxID=2866160 RepID=UPI001C7EB986|nr:glycosyltransferase family 2 protein [Hyphomonas sediminis]MBY9067958.1 glycosyltransferase [Hyphomonas sediminis]
MSGEISVILPTFNRANMIAETLDSLIAQTRPVREILVIDDGSTDNTHDVIMRYAQKVTYIRKENGGKASALNLGLERCTGDYIWICDDDDLLEPDACERLAGALDADSTLGFAAGKHEDFTIDSRTGTRLIKPPGLWRPSQPEEIFSDLLDGCHIFQPGLIVRREVYKQVGNFNRAFIRSQDYEMLLRIARATRGRLFPERVYLHREHAGDRGTAKERFSAKENNAKWIQFHRMIFEPLMADLNDRELLPQDVWSRPDVVPVMERVALLKRGRVFARHMMWEEALETFGKVAQLQPDIPFSPFEKDLVIGATASNFGCAPIYEAPANRSELMELKHISPTGRTIAALIGRSIHWRIRRALQKRKLRQAARMTTFALRSQI